MLHGILPNSHPLPHNATHLKSQQPPMKLQPSCCCLSPPLLSLPIPFSSLPSLKPRRLHPFRPLSSLKETKKPTLRKASNVPQNLKFENKKPERGKGGDGSEEEEGLGGGDAALKGTIFAGLLLVGVVGGFGSVGYFYKDQINAFLTQFSGFIDGYGPAGYAIFVAVYAGLEVHKHRGRRKAVSE